MIHATLALVLLSSPAHAHATGITGRSKTGCGTCHGTTSAASTTAAFTATTMTVAPGSVNNLIFNVSTTDASRTHGGLNVSASCGTLAGGVNTKKSGTEVTHKAATAMTTSKVAFRFKWTAPSSSTTCTLYGAGNAVNNNGAKSGDGWDLSPNLTITVTAADDGSPDAEEMEEVHDWAAADTGFADDEDLALAGDDGEEPASCATTGATAPLGLLGVAAAALLARRRR